MGEGVTIETLPWRADGRGRVLRLPPAVLRAFPVAELHWVTLRPGAVRGNHRHHGRRELLLVTHRDAWRLAWRGPDGVTRRRDFSGTGAVCVEIGAGVLHALHNTGQAELQALACSDRQPVPGDTEWETLLGGTPPAATRSP